MPAPLKIALLGCGVVGTQVVAALREHADDLAARAGAGLDLVGIVVRDGAAHREGVTGTPDEQLLTTDASPAIAQADVVVELMGGIEPARTLILEAFAGGASVVTANKALLAQHGPELYAAADAAGVDLFFEAAVAGAVPVVRAVRESLAGDRVERIMGIVNGTTNYVLDRMTREGLGLDEVVADAQRLGYAEADPTADVEGHDAAAKVAILASLAFHTRVALADVACEGIMQVSADDVAWAARTGYVVKLLGIAERTADGVIARVHPTLVPRAHPLAAVHGPFNAVFIEAAGAGELMFYGRGAGGAPTASAVLGDLVAVARHRVLGGRGPAESAYLDLPVLPASAARTRLQIRLAVADRPGVLEQVAAVFAAHEVSIEQVQQAAATPGDEVATLVITTHEASQDALERTVTATGALEHVAEVISVLRVEGV